MIPSPQQPDTWTGSDSFASFESVVAMWHHRLLSTPNMPGLHGRRRGSWYTLTWAQCGQRSKAIAAGLMSMGVQTGDRVALLCRTRPEWILIDMGILAAGAATTTIYPRASDWETRHILRDSGAKVVFVEDRELADKVARVSSELPELEEIVVVSGRVPNTLGLEELEARGRAHLEAHPRAYEDRTAAVRSQDLATLIYTSGTTDVPKGVMLSHDAWVFEGEAMDKLGLLSPADRHFLFLPLAHSFAKVLELAVIRTGVPTAVDGSNADLPQNLLAFRPTVMAAVPRVFEKLHNRVVSEAQVNPVLRTAFERAMEVGLKVSRKRQRGERPGRVLRARWALQDRLVFSRIRGLLGGRMRTLISGGAPLSKEMAEFFHASGLLILEGYGLTESAAGNFVNRPGRFRFGSVGLPLEGVKARIADDGEILLGGRGLMQGYWQDAEATDKALQDGWLHTGDIGKLDDAGFLTITDRKKNLIVTSGGKNVAPAPIEARLKAGSPYVADVLVHGDKRNYCVALVELDFEAVHKWAEANAVSAASDAELSQHPRVRQLVMEDVRRVNRDLASFESIKDIAILPRPLTVERGERTPSLKVVRRVVEEHYAEVLDAFYGDQVQRLG
ncbi:MAG: long-chain fatty acid--CoA ligase [Myxococcota bacterium]|nr:long-chain fatty acid--CoA ligase [Myxococcota bacterium]